MPLNKETLQLSGHSLLDICKLNLNMFNNLQVNEDKCFYHERISINHI